MTFLWFTCPKDYPKLAQSVRGIRKMEPRARLVACIDPSHEPPEGLEVVAAQFDRGTHLDGYNAAQGVMNVLGWFAEDDLVVKLDSDMAFSEPYWREGSTIFRRGNGSVFGSYALSGDLCAGIANSAASVGAIVPHEAREVGNRARIIAAATGQDLRVVQLDGYTPGFCRFF